MDEMTGKDIYEEFLELTKIDPSMIKSYTPLTRHLTFDRSGTKPKTATYGVVIFLKNGDAITFAKKQEFQ